MDTGADGAPRGPAVAATPIVTPADAPVAEKLPAYNLRFGNAAEGCEAVDAEL